MESKIRFKVWKMVLGIVALYTFSALPANAQWFNDYEDDSPFSAYVEADLVSRYMWRGLDKGGISIQPAVGISLWDFSFLATGNVGFDKEDEEELNLTLGFEKFGFNIGVIDYWQTGIDPENRYFHFKKKETAHALEGNIGYTHEYFSLQAYTRFAGHDYKINGERAYSTYVELSVPFHIGDIDIEGKVGVTPMESAGKMVYTGHKDDLGDPVEDPVYLYAETFSCNLVSARVTKTFYYKNMQFPIYAELHTNPYLRKANFLVGVSVVAF